MHQDASIASNLTPAFSGTLAAAPAQKRNFSQVLSDSGLFQSEADVIKNFDKLVDHVRSWLKLQNMTLPEACLDIMLEAKKGQFRKDQKTPSALHEITQAIWLISCLEDGLHLNDRQGVMSLIFTHDLGEDYGITPDMLEEKLKEKGIRPTLSVRTLKSDFDVISKRWGKKGTPKYPHDYAYYLAIQENQNASIAKMFDRPHNIMTLIGVKDKAEISTYVAKTLQLLNDFINECTQKFPTQEEIYATLKFLTEKEAQICRYFMVDTGKRITDNNDLRQSMPERGFRDLPEGLHPLIVPAERIRKTYPNTHITPDLLGDSAQQTP